MRDPSVFEFEPGYIDTDGEFHPLRMVGNWKDNDPKLYRLKDDGTFEEIEGHGRREENVTDDPNYILDVTKGIVNFREKINGT